MKPQALATSKNSSISYILNIIFGIILGLILMRIFMGEMPEEPTIYLKPIWVIFYPVILLRYLNNIVIFVVFYGFIWLYIILKKILILKKSPLKIIPWTVLWMGIIAIPFLVFGIEYFSITAYRLHHSYYLQRIPFLSLFTALFLSNIIYFKQEFKSALLWTLNIEAIIIILITLANFLPLATFHIDCNLSGYRITILNDLITKTPLLAVFSFGAISIMVFTIIDMMFIFQTKLRRLAKGFFAPMLITTLIATFILIFYVDYKRYNNIANSGEVNNISFNSYQSRQIIWFDTGKIRIYCGDFTMFYPFGEFDLRDTLRKHAKEIGEMTIIEGANKYKLMQILRILAHGPRDTVTYNALKNLVSGKYKRVPFCSDIRERYINGSRDINVIGWVMLNNKPLRNTDFCVNIWVRSVPESFERVWKDETDSNGKFSFNCYKGKDWSYLGHQIYFLPSDTLIGQNLTYLKITNIPHRFYTSGNYLLDTIKIETKKSESGYNFARLNILPRSPVDSFEIWMPAISESLGVKVTAEIIELGKIKIENIDIGHWEKTLTNKKTKNEIMRKVKKWRFFTMGEDRRIEIYINSAPPPLL